MSTPRLTLSSRVLLALGLLAGCNDPAREPTRSLVEAVSHFRAAEDAAKHARITDIERVPCAAPDVCEARAACLHMAATWDHSIQLRAEVKATLAELEQHKLQKEDPRAQALPAVLDESEAALKEARVLDTACDERLSSLSVRHR